MNTDFTQSKKPYWRTMGGCKPGYSVIRTGHTELDACLQLGGWPVGVTTELGLHDDGIGELRLLMPALRERLRENSNYAVWVAPPYLPNAAALIKEGIDNQRLIIVQVNGLQDILWATEQALSVDSCAAVFSWMGRHNLNAKQTRRLQLAAEKSNCWHVQFRHLAGLQQVSAARLRLQLCSNTQGTLGITVQKQPQGGAGQKCTVSLAPHYQLWQRIPAPLLPQYNRPLVKQIHKKERATQDQPRLAVTNRACLVAKQ